MCIWKHNRGYYMLIISMLFEDLLHIKAKLYLQSMYLQQLVVSTNSAWKQERGIRSTRGSIPRGPTGMRA